MRSRIQTAAVRSGRVLLELNHTGSDIIRALCFTRGCDNPVRYFEADTLFSGVLI